MLKAEVGSGACDIEAQGSVLDVADDVGKVIRGIYDGYQKKEPVLAAAFRAAMAVVVSQDSPVWKPVEHGIAIIIPTDKKSGGAPTDQS